jgi:hypothetical protein
VSRPSRDIAVASAVATFLVAGMAIDHLVGTESDPGEDSGLADPGAFVLSTILSLALMAALFLLVVRRTHNPAAAATRGAVCSGLAIPAVVLSFLGLPFPLAAAGIALGLRGRTGEQRRLANADVVVGSLVVAALTVGYVAALMA